MTITYRFERESDGAEFEFDCDYLGIGRTFDPDEYIGDTEPDMGDDEYEEWATARDDGNECWPPAKYLNDAECCKDLTDNWETITQAVKDLYKDPTEVLEYLKDLKEFLTDAGDEVIWVHDA